MRAIESHVRSWGRSVGVVIPKEIAVKEKIGEGDVVEFILFKKSNALKETFGKLKLKKTTDQILKEIDEESWDEG